MRILQISANPGQHKNLCLSDFLSLWFSGQSEGNNPIARGLKYGVKSQVTISKDDIVNLVRKGYIYYNQKKVPHLPFKAQGTCKILIAIPDEILNRHQIKSNEAHKLSQKDIVFEDQDMVVINKPSGLPSQGTLNVFDDNALSSLMSFYIQKNKGLKAPYLNLMHRLDKDTSGLLMFSKKIAANKNLTDLFESRKINKTYLAGVLKTNDFHMNQSFKVSGLIKKSPQPGMSFYFKMDEKEGLPSETNFKIIAEDSERFLIECSPKTGRSHQIRVHLKSVGLPILGDIFYNPQSKSKRLMLHAWKLEFKHPMNQKILNLEAPAPESFIV